MIQPISQQIINQYSFVPQKRSSFQGISDLQIVNGDKEGDIKKMRRDYNILLFLFASLTAMAAWYISKGKNFSHKKIMMPETEFVSLKDNPKIPTVDTCKSLNKNLKTKLERQINIEKAGEDAISEIGEGEMYNNRILLYGPSGTGKSFFAKVFAKSTNAEYLEIKFSDWNSRWSGATGEKMDATFMSILKTAEQNPDKKYVVTFNEIDSLIVPPENLVGSKGSAAVGKLEERSIFINNMDMLKEKVPNVTIIGTTNINPESGGLDKAVLSRLQNFIEVPYPDENCLFEALKMNIGKMKNGDSFLKNNEDSLIKLAQKMEKRRFSFRNLEFITSEAQNMYLDDILKGGKKEFKIDYLQEAEKALKLSDGELNKVA